jgi:hypothetical protein
MGGERSHGNIGKQPSGDLPASVPADIDVYPGLRPTQFELLGWPREAAVPRRRVLRCTSRECAQFLSKKCRPGVGLSVGLLPKSTGDIAEALERNRFG